MNLLLKNGVLTMLRKRLSLINRFVELESILKCKDLRNIELITFDVFDTLLFRRCSTETVQRGVAAALAKALGNEYNSAIDTALHAREQAYAEVALSNQNTGLDFDAHLDAINLAWVKRLAPDKPECWSELESIARDAKMKFERWACYPNPVMPGILGKLREYGKRLIFV